MAWSAIRNLMHNTRSQVYLLWAVLVGIGFTATHYYQDPNINIVWTIISVIGLGFMYKVMPLRVKQMRRIFIAWLVPITFGMVISVIAARTDLFSNLVSYLGPFWMVVMAVGYFWNGLVDRPMQWYVVAAVANIATAILCLNNGTYLQIQYLLAAIVNVWAMLNLLIFRSE